MSFDECPNCIEAVYRGQVAVDQVTDSGQLFRTTGIVTEASYGQSDGALTLYKLTLKTRQTYGTSAVIVVFL